MATQPALVWGSLAFCSPLGSRVDSYDLTDRGVAAHDGFEYAIPNTTGRQKRILGVAQRERTSPFYIFRGRTAGNQAYFTAFFEALKAAKSDTSTPHKTLFYGVCNGTTTYSENFCDCEFSPQRFWLFGTGSGTFCLEWTAKFSKWGA